MIAELDISTPTMQTALQRAPDTDLTIVQQHVVETGGLDVVLDVRGAFDRFEAGLEEDNSVTDWLRFSTGQERRRYRVTLTERGRELSTQPRWSNDGAVFLDGRRQRDRWRFRLQLPGEQSLQRYVAYCDDRNISLDPVRLCRSNSATSFEHYGLTATQARTLVDARQRGFFQIPRDCTLEELAAASNITHQALSERLRRGTESLIDATLR
jgi:predicted DNA binding protein